MWETMLCERPSLVSTTLSLTSTLHVLVSHVYDVIVFYFYWMLNSTLNVLVSHVFVFWVAYEKPVSLYTLPKKVFKTCLSFMFMSFWTDQLIYVCVKCPSYAHLGLCERYMPLCMKSNHGVFYALKIRTNVAYFKHGPHNTSNAINSPVM